jgi:hypothetical protein
LLNLKFELTNQYCSFVDSWSFPNKCCLVNTSCSCWGIIVASDPHLGTKGDLGNSAILSIVLSHLRTVWKAMNLSVWSGTRGDTCIFKWQMRNFKIILVNDVVYSLTFVITHILCRWVRLRYNWFNVKILFCIVCFIRCALNIIVTNCWNNFVNFLFLNLWFVRDIFGSEFPASIRVVPILKLIWKNKVVQTLVELLSFLELIGELSFTVLVISCVWSLLGLVCCVFTTQTDHILANLVVLNEILVYLTSHSLLVKALW